MMPGAAENPLERLDLRARVQKALAGYVTAATGQLEQISEELSPVAACAAEFVLAGGKRLRPAFCYWGWRAAGGADGEEIVVAAASLELLHGCALAHDDVMDGSDLRRGRPAVHRQFRRLHEAAGWRGDPAVFGRSSAVLIGDLLLVWADQMLMECGLPAEAVRRAWPAYHDMRVELMAGQYLDLVEQARAGDDLERALRVARYKTARYTIERPLHLGALLAGGAPGLLTLCSGYGLPLGEAFQLRDDVLGVFGDPAETGKPAGDDLREGKRTALVAATLARADGAEAALVDRLLGDPDLDEDGVGALRTVIVRTGALAAVEALIAERARQAMAALRGEALPGGAGDVLADLAAAATARAH